MYCIGVVICVLQATRISIGSSSCWTSDRPQHLEECHVTEVAGHLFHARQVTTSLADTKI